MKIYLSKKIISDFDISDNGIMAYIAMRILVRSEETSYHVSGDGMCFALTGQCVQQRFLKKRLLEGLDNLIELGLVTVEGVFTNSSKVCNLSKLILKSFNQSNEFFIQVELSDIKRVMNMDTKACKEKVLRYYVSLIGTFSNVEHGKTKCKIGKVGLLYLSSISGIPVSSITKSYNDLLMDNKIIYYKSFIKDDNENKRAWMPVNMYCHYKDKDILKKYVEDNNLNVRDRKYDLNNSRSLMQKYNAMKRGTKYSLSDTKEIYEFILDYNKRANEEKDVSVFSSYLQSM